MEAAAAGAAEFGRVGRRLMQKIWDPEPVNNRVTNEPVWCLGRSYTLDVKNYGLAPITSSTPPSDSAEAASLPPPNNLDTPPDSVASSFDSSLAYEEPGQDGGWPPEFVDDFESRIWMTYRTEFEPIPKSTDPRAASALSFTMRLKTSFADQNGFSSDTGWGCMIRSGQSLLANAISIARLGRGMSLSSATRNHLPSSFFPMANDESKTGDAAKIPTQSGLSYPYSQTTLGPPTRSTTSSSMALSPVGSIRASGSDRRPLHGVYSSLRCSEI